ncbi:MAG: hypothetical protein ABI175_25240 [Polyangiales bacterium]
MTTIVGCGRTPPDRVGPSPESKPAPSTTTPPTQPPPADLTFTDVYCQYGGTAPAFFIWAEATARTRITGLRATAYEIADKAGTFVSGVSGAFPMAVRVRKDKKGVGDVTYLTTPLEAGTTVHLEVFGGLAFTAFGPKVDYPNDDRGFRVELVADQGMWTITGTCVVGPSG